MISHKFLMSNGDQMFSLVDQNYIPYTYPSYYITSELYLDNHSINTMEKHVYELKFFLEWLDSASIDIVDRVERGMFLTDAEIYQFAGAAKIRSQEQRQDDSHTQQTIITDKLVSNGVASHRAAQARVKPSTTNGRIILAVNYIEFLSREIHIGIMPEATVNRLCRTLKLLKAAKLRISNHAANGAKYDGFNSMIPDDVFNRMLTIIDPLSPDNPFKHSRERNQLIVEILASTGIRRGALAKLKIPDIVFTNDANRLYIRRTPEDLTDSRQNKPQQKTREHSTYIAPILVEDIESYISHIRAIIPNACSHEFVFVSEMNSKGTQGAPLSLKSIDYIFNVLSKALGTAISPHMLRHKWNEIFTDQTDHLPAAEADKRRVDAMGWSKTSVMPERYNHFKNLQKAYEIQKDIQHEILGAGKS
ncbi:MAG: integrase [Phenylobacterium sp.]|jgi:integrase